MPGEGIDRLVVVVVRVEHRMIEFSEIAHAYLLGSAPVRGSFPILRRPGHRALV
jgi:hypothetical protein